MLKQWEIIMNWWAFLSGPDIESGDEYWISRCRKDGNDALYNTDVEIDKDVLEEYWVGIRNQPHNVNIKSFMARGKY